MERTPGWQLVRDRIDEEIRLLEREIEDLEGDVHSKSAREIGEIFIRVSQGLAGLKKVLTIIEDFKRE